jgi:hypothetical protein
MKLTNIRKIAPAVRDVRAQTGNTAFQRRAPKLDYAKTRQRWWIQLRFNSDIDLMILEKAVAGSEIRLVELENSFYLEDPRIPDSAEMGEAFRIAENLLAQLNGATQVSCSHFQPARFESMVELFENGTGRGIVMSEFVVHGSSDYPAIGTFLTSELTPIGSMLPVWKSDEAVQDALFYLGAEGNVWASLYKACEIVEDHVGGGPKVIFQNGWCSRAAWDRFHRTANHQEAIGFFSRHARSKTVPPSDPMTATEARSFVAGLMKEWIQSLVGAVDAQEPPRKVDR